MGDSFFESLSAAVERFLTDYAGDGTASSRSIDMLFDVMNAPSSALETTGAVGLGRIREHDPDFDLGTLLRRVGEMFAAYHEAADNGDLQPARRFVAEESWSALDEAAENKGRRHAGPRAFHIDAIRPMTATHEDGLDTVRVLINAHETQGDADPICEYWELVRSRGTQTKAGLDLTHCPNCGAPIDGDDPTRCAYCGQRLADPALDWVVRKITEQ